MCYRTGQHYYYCGITTGGYKNFKHDFKETSDILSSLTIRVHSEGCTGITSNRMDGTHFSNRAYLLILEVYKCYSKYRNDRYTNCNHFT